MATKMYDTEVIGRRGKWRPTRVWMDEVKDSLRGRSLTFVPARMTLHDRME